MNCYLALANKLCGQHAWPNLRVAGAIRAEEQAERPESRSTALLPSAASPPHCVLVERMWTAPGPKNTQQHNSLQAVSIAFQQDADRVRGVARLLTLPPRLTSPPRKTTTEEQACSSSLVLQGLAFFPSRKPSGAWRLLLSAWQDAAARSQASLQNSKRALLLSTMKLH